MKLDTNIEYGKAKLLILIATRQNNRKRFPHTFGLLPLLLEPDFSAVNKLQCQHTWSSEIGDLGSFKSQTCT